ncbi:50S ribosomal protein L18e [Candidatus Woesearchaeota archaeon]|nr:50S ribosomal protein L18e [Candidatus Woesearchaeota archaeon]
MKTNLQTRETIAKLNKSKVAMWKRVAKEFDKPTKGYARVNLEKITKVVREGEIALVLGKVLSVGDIRKKTVVGAFAFSEVAKQKIIAAGGEALTIQELFAKNPKGSKVRLMK